MKKRKILSFSVFTIFIIFIVDFYNLLQVSNFEFPANTYKNALYIPENYINLDYFLEDNKDYISMSGLSHEVGFLDIDLGLIEAFAYESNAFKRKYFSWNKDIYVDKDVAVKCLERAKFISECREREYKVDENIKKEKYSYIFDVKFAKPEYSYEGGQYLFSVKLENFEYTSISADSRSDYLQTDERKEFIENLVSYITSDTGVIFSDYKFDYKTNSYIFEIEMNSKIESMVIANPLYDYLIGSEFERTVHFDLEDIELKTLDNAEEYILYVGDTAGYTAHEYKVVDSGENYTMEQEVDTNKYRVTVFNDSGVIFKNVFFGTSPIVKTLDNNLVEILKGYGNGNNYSIFVDTERGLISNALNVKQPAFIVNERVLSVEQVDDKVYATFTSLFDVRACIDRYELKNAENFNYVSNMLNNVVKNVGYSYKNTIMVKYLDVDSNLQSQEIKIVNSEENTKKDNSYNDKYVLYVDDNTGHIGYEYEIVDSGKNHTVEWEVDTDKYRVTIFNDSGVIFKDVFFGTEPSIEILDNNLVEIFKGYGTGAYLSIFVDTEKELVSNAFNIRQPVFVVNERVLGVEYIDDNVYATFSSLFDVKASKERYELKNAYNSNLVPDIEDVSYSDDTIEIKYLNVDSNLQSQKIKIVNSEVASKERNVYNKENEDVNRFLQYLNDEIPMYTQNGSYLYFSERVEENMDFVLDEASYYIFDFDGDGENELMYSNFYVSDVIKYDNSSDSFALWLETYHRSRPLTTLQMYTYVGGMYAMYEQEIFDKYGNLIDSKGYIFGDEPDAYGNPKMYYSINGKELTQDEWNKDSKEFFELKKNAPSVLTYSDLLIY